MQDHILILLSNWCSMLMQGVWSHHPPSYLTSTVISFLIPFSVSCPLPNELVDSISVACLGASWSGRIFSSEDVWGPVKLCCRAEWVPFVLPRLGEFISYAVLAAYAFREWSLDLVKSGRMRGMEAPMMTKVFSMTTQFMNGTVLTRDTSLVRRKRYRACMRREIYRNNQICPQWSSI